MGELIEPFVALAPPGVASDQQRLIGSAMMAALRARDTPVDFAVHGLFTSGLWAPGSKTVADVWTLLPYENDIVTLALRYPDLLALAQELSAAHDPLPLMGARAVGQRTATRFTLSALQFPDGSPLPADGTYRVAFNSYDTQSGGGRYPLLAGLTRDPKNKRVLHSIRIRDALIDFFVSRGRVDKGSLLV